MIIKHLSIILLFLSLSYGEDENTYMNFQEHDFSPLEDKISPILSALKTEMFRKFDTMDKNILESLQTINSKLDSSDKKLDMLNDKLSKLEKNNHGLEEIIREKLHNLERNILDKLEEYIDDKFDATEKHIYRKIDAQEKFLPDKTDITILSHKIDALKKLQPDLNGSIICNPKVSENKTLGQLSEKMNQTLDTIQKHLSELVNTTVYLKREVMDNGCSSIENNLTSKLIEIKKMIPDMEKNMKSKLDDLNNKIPEHLNENIKQKLDTMEKIILDSKDNISCYWDASKNQLVQNLDNKLDEIKKKIPGLEQIVDKNIEALKKVKSIPDYWGCREREVHGYGYNFFNRMDDQTLNHVTFKNNSDGLIYYKMHIAIKSDSDGHILLSAVPNPEEKDLEFEIVIGSSSNQHSVIRNHKKGENKVDKTTPNILTPTGYTAFYFKVDNGTLEVGKRDEVVLTLKDDRLKTLKYYSFAAWDYHHAIFLYDCPLNVEDYAI